MLMVACHADILPVTRQENNSSTNNKKEEVKTNKLFRFPSHFSSFLTV